MTAFTGYGALDVALDAAYLEALALRPGVGSWRGEGVVAVRSGATSNAENGVVSGPGAAVGDALAFVADVPARWLVPGGAGRELAASLRAAGAEEDTGAVTMGASMSELPLDVQPPPDVLIELADDEEVWEWALGEASFVLGDAGRASSRYLAWAGAVPVALAVSFVSGDAVVLQHLWVRDAARRQGIGTAMSARRLRDAAALGATRAVVGPTPESAAFHASLGFHAEPLPPGTVWLLPYREG